MKVLEKVGRLRLLHWPSCTCRKRSPCLLSASRNKSQVFESSLQKESLNMSISRISTYILSTYSFYVFHISRWLKHRCQDEDWLPAKACDLLLKHFRRPLGESFQGRLEVQRCGKNRMVPVNYILWLWFVVLVLFLFLERIWKNLFSLKSIGSKIDIWFLAFCVSDWWFFGAVSDMFFWLELELEQAVAQVICHGNLIDGFWT